MSGDAQNAIYQPIFICLQAAISNLQSRSAAQSLREETCSRDAGEEMFPVLGFVFPVRPFGKSKSPLIGYYESARRLLVSRRAWRSVISH